MASFKGTKWSCFSYSMHWRFSLQFALEDEMCVFKKNKVHTNSLKRDICQDLFSTKDIISALGCLQVTLNCDVQSQDSRLEKSPTRPLLQMRYGLAVLTVFVVNLPNSFIAQEGTEVFPACSGFGTMLPRAVEEKSLAPRVWKNRI